jgi:hypothetical protein
MANDIAALQTLVGDKAVATQIAEAIAAEGLDKFALASDLTALAVRVKALEDAGFQNAEQGGSAIDTKIAALNLADTYEAKGAAATAEANAKAYTDNLTEFVTTVSQKASSAMTSAQNAERDAGMAKSELGQLKTKVGAVTEGKTVVEMIADAQAYTDTEVAKIQALTTAEIDAAIAAAKA